MSGLRVLYLPVISARNVNAAPSFNWFRAVRRIADEQGLGVTWYVLVPRVGGATRWQAGADWSGPRTHVIETDMAESQFVELGLVTREFFELFNERFGSLHFDLILSEKPMLAPLLKQLSEFHITQKTRGTTLINRDQFTQTKEVQKCSPEVEMLQAVGWWSSISMFQSEHQRRRAEDVVRRHLTPSHVNRMLSNAEVVPLGIDCSEVDSVNLEARDQKPTDHVLIQYSAKLFDQNRYVQSLKIMDSVFAGGRKVELQIVTGSAKSKLTMVPKARPYAWITCYGGTGREEFLRRSAAAHVFISNSPWEDFSATICELLYTGVLPVVPDAPWARYLLPSGYPLLFRSMEEGQAMLRHAVDNVEELRAEWVPKIRSMVLAEFDLAVVVPEMIALFNVQVNERRRSMKAATPKIRQLVRDAMTVLPTEFGEPEFYDAIRKVSDGLDPERDVESRSTSKWMLVDVMLDEFPELIDLGTRERRWRRG